MNHIYSKYCKNVKKKEKVFFYDWTVMTTVKVHTKQFGHKGTGICLMFFRLYFPWQWAHSSLQSLIQPWICTPGTHYGWVDQGSVEYEVCPTLPNMASTGNRTLDLLILSPTPYSLDFKPCITTNNC